MAESNFWAQVAANDLPPEFRDIMLPMAQGGLSGPQLMAGLDILMKRQQAEREIEQRANELMMKYQLGQMGMQQEGTKMLLGNQLGLEGLAQKREKTAAEERWHGKNAEALVGAASLKAQGGMQQTLTKLAMEKSAQKDLEKDKIRLQGEAKQKEEQSWAPNLKTYSDATKKMPAPVALSLIQSDPSHPISQRAVQFARGMADNPAETPAILQAWANQYATDPNKLGEWEAAQLAKAEQARKRKTATPTSGGIFTGLGPQEMQQPVPWERTLPGMIQGGLGNTTDDFWRQTLP